MSAAKTSLGKGLFDFGVAVNKANARGVVVTKCSSSQYECILSPMMDYSGMFAMLAVNANNGSTIRVDYPAAALTAQTPVFASLLSHDGRFYYNHFGNYFMQFDATTLSFTFVAKTSQGTAMGMTVDDSGVIWSATYPKSGLVSFNPKNREFRDYGFVYNQTWYMYQRNIAADDLGYIYIAVGSALSQFVCFHPNTSQSWPLLAENQRISGSPWLYRDNDGKVYGLNVNSSPMFMFYGGIMTQLSSPHTRSYKFYISGTQYLFYGNFPSGRILKTFDPESKTFSIQQNPNNTSSVITLLFLFMSRSYLNGYDSFS
ncbi:hypothetical protein C9374_000347 [Naegleria lovaniensis]|uniref:Uncharacterized protein n=1 Tax=Naegleria lovaniensis TaxID=51637 RepID=A0AA88GYV2_NAELO|nr:uncharacterized protein C9374_000347 [Naegleria lovaniensis]KAG2388908.1 hypothetical protein C9374_000347 [Naegleria lovaniensis]